MRQILLMRQVLDLSFLFQAVQDVFVDLTAVFSWPSFQVKVRGVDSGFCLLRPLKDAFIF